MSSCNKHLENYLAASPDSLSLPHCAVVTTSSATGTKPEKPSRCAAAGETSIIRLLVNGPRSLMRTMTVCRFFKLVTRTSVPKGSERCAAVSFVGEHVSQLAVCPVENE